MPRARFSTGWGIRRDRKAQRGTGAGGGGGGGPQTPATILGSLLHADFDVADPGIVLNAGAVASIPNRGTDTAAMVQGTASSQPAFSATSFAGGPGATFDGINDSLVCAFAVAIAAGRRPYVWLVFKANNTTAAEQSAASLYGSTSLPWFVVWSNRAGAPSKFSSGMRPTTAGTFDAAAMLGDTETANTHLAEVGATVGGIAGYVFDNVATNVAAGVSAPTSDPLIETRLGGYGVAPAQQLSGCTIRRIIVANDLPSPAQINAMRAYLRAQPYGLTF